jgi:hypothetical protein
MKACHAAAIALVSWYLVAPPVRDSGTEPAYLDTHADYREWKVLHTFNSIDDCEAGDQRAKSDAADGDLTAFGDDGASIGAFGTSLQPLLDQQTAAECIAADDPRIEGIKSK